MSIDLLDGELIRFGPTGAQASEPAVAPAQIAGPCALCHERTAARRCVNCERLVCVEDHWAMLGLCKACASDEEVRRGREGAERPRPELDIKWIED